MTWQIDLIIIVLFFTSIVAAVLAGMAWRRRSTTGGRQLSGLMLGVAIWAFTTALEFTSPSIDTRILISGFQYFGIATVPVSYLSFALSFSGNTRWRTRRNLILMWAIPAITIILAFTNQYHHLIWTSFTPQPLGSSFLVVYGHGIGLWIATVYFYLCLLGGLLLVIRHTILQKGIYRSQGIMVLIGLVIPWIGNIAYMFGFSPIPGLDLAPVTSTISGLVLILAVLQFRLLDLIPIARNAVIDLMQDGVIVLDTQGRLVDINPAACALLNKKQDDVLGLSTSEVFSPWPKFLEQYAEKEEVCEEIVLPEPSGKVLDLRITTIRDKHDLTWWSPDCFT